MDAGLRSPQAALTITNSRRIGRAGALSALLVVLVALNLATWYAGNAYLAESAIRGGQLLAALVGLGDDMRYLVLAQNPAELRPTGGYAGTVGIVHFVNGRLVEQKFDDVYYYDLRPGVPYVEPPPELANHLLGDGSWQLADANWSLDFPTSAANALRLYTLETGDDDIDGVIALTTTVIDRLLAVTGPIEVPEYGVTVASGEVTLTAMRLTRGISTPTSDRKAFLDALANHTLDALLSLPPMAWPGLLDAFAKMGEHRDLLVWFRDPTRQASIADMSIAGRIRHDAGDYVAVVEANVSPTSKYNLVVRRSDTLEVTIDTAGNIASRLRLDWQNDALLPGEPYEAIRSYSTSKVGQYGAYVRLLTPGSSLIQSAEGQATVAIQGAEETGTDAGRNVFGNYLLMNPGASSLSYSWSAPAVAVSDGGAWTYRLTIQKQPGAAPTPTSVSVMLPEGATVDAIPGNATAEGRQVSLQTNLDRDAQFEIRYRLP